MAHHELRLMRRNPGSSSVLSDLLANGGDEVVTSDWLVSSSTACRPRDVRPQFLIAIPSGLPAQILGPARISRRRSERLFLRFLAVNWGQPAGGVCRESPAPERPVAAPITEAWSYRAYKCGLSALDAPAYCPLPR